MSKHLKYIANQTGGEIRISRGNVPHMIIERDGVTFSVCYFGKSKTFRIFFPYPADEQKRFDLMNRDDVVEFFNDEKVRAKIISGIYSQGL